MDNRRKKLKFRAWHRGFREMDLIMGSFADAHIEALSDAQLDRFEEILGAPDQDVYSWIAGRAPTPPEFETDVMDMVKKFRYADTL